MERTPTSSLSRDRIIAPTLGFVLLLLYAFTMPHTVTLEDSGSFLVTSYFFGLAHPPGYPLYTLLGHLITQIPLGSVAARLHFFSAMAAAGACVFVFLILRRWRLNEWLAVAMAATFGTSQLLWYEATIAEVYALNAFLFFALFYWALVIVEDKTFRWFPLWCGLYALSLCNHWPLMLMATPALVILLTPQWRSLLQYWQLCCLWTMAGLVPYAHLFLTSLDSSRLLYLGPVAGIGDFIDYVSRQLYKSEDVQTTADWYDSWQFVRYFVGELPRQIGWTGIVAVLLGLRYTVHWRAILALSLAALSSTVLLKFVMINDFDPLRRDAYMAYQLIPIGAIVMIAGWGLHGIAQRIHSRHARLLLLGTVALMPISNIVVNYSSSQRHEDTFAEDYGRIVLESLPQQAQLFLYGDSDFGPITYTAMVAGVRPDVVIRSEYGYLFPNRVFDPRSADARTIVRRNRQLIEEIAPVFTTGKFPSLREDLNNEFSFTFNGLYYQVGGEVPSAAATEAASADLAETIVATLERYQDKDIHGSWIYHRGDILSHYCNVLVLQNIDHPIFEKSPHCKVIQARHLQQLENHRQADVVYAELIEMEPLLEKSEWHEVVLGSLLNRLALINSTESSDLQREFQRLADDHISEVWRYPICSNKVLGSLLQIRQQIMIDLPQDRLRQRFASCGQLATYW